MLTLYLISGLKLLIYHSLSKKNNFTYKKNVMAIKPPEIYLLKRILGLLPILPKNIITIENLFKNKNSIEIDKRRLELFLNGVRLSTDLKSDIYRIYCEDKFVGIGEVKNKLLKRDIIVI